MRSTAILLLLLLVACGDDPAPPAAAEAAHPFVGDRALSAADAGGPAWLELGRDRLSFGTIGEGASTS